MTDEIDNERVKDAWDRVARTRDGLLIYRHLQRLRLGLATDHSALPHFEGRRSLAADLMAYMAEGIAENDRACVTFAVAKPAAVSPSRGAGRRITADTFIPGYDATDREPGAANGSDTS